MKKLLFLFVLLPLIGLGQSDTTTLKSLIGTNFPDNTSGAITPADLREVSEELMRSSANLLERNEFAEPLQVNDTIKSEQGFFKWNGSGWSEVGSLSDTAVWARSGGFILPKEYADKLSIDTARVEGLLYPTGNVNIGSSSAPFDTVFANAFSTVSCACLKEASLTIASADVLQLNSTPLTIVPAQGVGTAIEVISASVKIDFNTTAYATNVNLTVGCSGATDVQHALQCLNSTVATNRRLNGQTATGTTDTQYLENTAVEVTVATGNPTAGDSDITVYVVYRVITL